MDRAGRDNLALRLRAAGHSCERVARLLGTDAARVRRAVLARLAALREEVAAERPRLRLVGPV